MTPWTFMALRAAFAAATSSSAVGFGTREPNTSNAASSSRPVGCPLASRQILPPTGSGVLAVILASCRARVLASTVWPNEERMMTGRLVFSTSRAARVVLTPAGRMLSWNQLTTSSQASGSLDAEWSRHPWTRCWSSATVSDS